MDETRKTDLEIKWRKVAARAVSNDDFKQRLTTNTIAVLGEYGMTLPQGAQARVNADKEINLLLPPNASKDLEEETKWWKRRLDMIRDFSKEDLQKPPPTNIPEGCDDV
jgi:hypothetical protein